MSGFLGGGIGPVALKRRAAASGNGLLNNLIAYWPLNEAGGANNALDLHSNALTLTQVASPGSAAGKVYAGARTFNGSTQYFNRASEALLTLGDVDYTVAAWVYLSSKSTGVFALAKGNAVDGADWDHALSYLQTSDRMRWTIGNGTGLSSVLADTHGSPALNTWLFVVAWHVSATKTIYISVNNGAADSAPYTGTHDTTTKPFAIGALSDYGPSRWSGRIGPVAIWKSAPGGGVLSAAQRTALWANGNGLPYAQFTT